MYEILTEAKNINKKIREIVPKVEDPELKSDISEINDTASKIIDTIEKKPEKYKNIGNFFTYYLPVTVKILQKYDEIENQRLSSKDSKEYMSSTKSMIRKINGAFKTKLSNLYQADIIDSDAEMKVFDAMLKSDGYNDNNDFNIK